MRARIAVPRLHFQTPPQPTVRLDFHVMTEREENTYHGKHRKHPAEQHPTAATFEQKHDDWYCNGGGDHTQEALEQGDVDGAWRTWAGQLIELQNFVHAKKKQAILRPNRPLELAEDKYLRRKTDL